MEKKERAESDMREYGNDYDVRLSVRVHQKHLDRLDAIAGAYGKSRAVTTRDIIDSAYKSLEKQGRV